MDALDSTSNALMCTGGDNLGLELIDDLRITSKHDSDLRAGIKTSYDDQRASYKPSPSMSVEIKQGIKEATKCHHRVLRSTLAKALRQTDLIAKIKYQPQGCGWEDVLDCIASAKATYNNKGKRNKVRAWSRHASTTADFLQSLAGIIPDEEGLSVLRQGLILLFQAWQRCIKNREEILRQLENLPVLLSTATETWGFYFHDDRLKNAVLSLYEMVVYSISDLIEILLRIQEGSFIVKYMHRIPAIESERINDIANNISTAKEKVDSCVKRLKHERLASIHLAYRSTVSESRFIKQMLREQHETRMRAMRDIIPGPSRIIPGPSRIMMHAIKEFAALECESQSQGDKHNLKRDIFKDCFRTILATTMQTNLYRQLERATTVEVRAGTYTDMDPPNPANAAQRMFTKTELLWQLRLSDFGFSHQDVEIIGEEGTDLAWKSDEMSGEISSTTQGAEWMTLDHSRLLLVEGHCKNFVNGKTSPLSVFCASLASYFARSDSVVILDYYCGQHGVDLSTHPAGPVSLIRSLIAQLLRKSDDVLPQSLWLDMQVYEGAMSGRIDGLCRLFELLFSHINPTKITICVIDEIAEFEGVHDRRNDIWGHGMVEVAHSLWRLVNGVQAQKLKVMMTCANKSVLVKHILYQHEKYSFG